jgi:hypothetical protein
VVDPSAWLNAENSLALCSCVMPMPVSATATSRHTLPSRSSSRVIDTWMCPSSVNLTALLIRLVRIWLTRSGSPKSPCGMSSATLNTSSKCFSLARCPISVLTLPSTSSTQNGMVSIVSAPASIFEKSRMSLMMPSNDTPAVWTWRDSRAA